MWWSCAIIAGIVFLALAFRIAVKGTPFTGRCACTPYIKHLRHLEDQKSEESDIKIGNLW